MEILNKISKQFFELGFKKDFIILIKNAVPLVSRKIEFILASIHEKFS